MFNLCLARHPRRRSRLRAHHVTFRRVDGSRTNADAFSGMTDLAGFEVRKGSTQACHPARLGGWGPWHERA